MAPKASHTCWRPSGPVAVPPGGAGSTSRLSSARELLDAERARVVQSTELEAITGLTRYELARQFRLRFGTSPHRYLLGHRLELARQRVRAGRPLADVADEAGFADQAHFTRRFKVAFGLTPGRYRALIVNPRTIDEEAT